MPDETGTTPDLRRGQILTRLPEPQDLLLDLGCPTNSSKPTEDLLQQMELLTLKQEVDEARQEAYS